MNKKSSLFSSTTFAFRSLRHFLCLLPALALTMVGNAQAQTHIQKSDTTTMNGSADWGGTAPVLTLIGEFGATPQATTLANMTLGGNVALDGLQFDSTMQGPLTIATGSTLTLGTGTTTTGGGILFQAGAPSVTINATVALGTSPETFTTVTGATLTIPTITMGSGNTLVLAGTGNFNLGGISTGNGTGNVGVTTTGTFTGTDVNIGKSSSSTTTLPTATTAVGAVANAGFYVSGAGAVVNLNTLEMSTQNGGFTGLITNGSTTVSGQVIIGDSTSGGATAVGRGAYFQVSGGSFTASSTTTGIILGENNTSSHENLAELYVSGTGVVTAGRIAFGVASDTIGGTGWIFIGSGGTLYVGSGGIVEATPVAAFSANIALNNGLLGASANWASSLNMQLSGTATTPFTIKTADANNVAHNISLSGNLTGIGALNETGTGTLTLSGTDSFAGALSVLNGTLAIPTINNVSTSGPLGNSALAVNLGNTGGVTGTLEFTGSGAASSTKPFNMASGGTGDFQIDNSAANLTLSGAIGGTGALGVSGAGTLTLSGATASNTYSGGTVITGGTLSVASGSGTGSGNVFVNGGTLAGAGTISGTVTVGGGTVAPGAVGTTLTIGGLTYSTGTLKFSLNGTGGTISSSAITTTNATFSALPTITFNVSNFSTADSGQTVTLLTSTNPIADNGNLANIAATHLGRLTITPSEVGGPGGTTIIATASGGPATLTWAGGVTGLGTGAATGATQGDTTTWSNTQTPGSGVGGAGNFNNGGNYDYFFDGDSVTFNDTVSPGSGTINYTVLLTTTNSPGSVTVNTTGTYIFNNGGGSIAGNGSLTLSAGTLDLNTANSYTGGTTISAGTLKAGIAGALPGTGTVTLAGTIDLGGFNQTIGALTDNGATTGTIEDTGGSPNNLTLSTGGSVSGQIALSNLNLTVSSGTLNLTGTLAGTSPVSVATSGSGVITETSPGFISGAGITFTQGSSGTSTLGGANTYTGATTVSAGTLSLTGSLTGSGVVTSGTGSFTESSTGSIADGTVPGSSFTQGSSGTSTLGAANTYTGGTTLSAGTLVINNATAIGTGTLTISGGALDSTVAGITLGNVENWSGNFGFAGTQSLNLGTGAVTLSNNPTVNVAANTLTVGGVIGGGTQNLTKAGAGTLILTGNNTYSGTTTDAAGILQINSGGAISGTAANVSDGAGGIVVNGGSLTESGASAYGNANGFVVENNGTASFGALTADNGAGSSITVETGGSLTATSITNSRTSGTFTSQALAETGGGTGILVSGGSLTDTGVLGIGTPSATNSSSYMDVTGGTVSVSGVTTITNSNGSRFSILAIQGGTFNSTNTGTGVEIGGASFFTATTAIDAELYIAGGTADINTITFGDSTQTSGSNVLHLSSGSLYVGAGGMVSGGSTPAPTITLGGGILGAEANWSSSLPMTLSGATIQTANSSGTAENITLSGPLSGAGALTTTGTGTLTLSGSNTYSGGTVINNGTLLANNASGSATGTMGVTVNSGAFLGGTGTINTSGVTTGTAITVNGTLSPSGGSGSFSNLNLTLASGVGTSVNLSNASFVFDLGASGTSDNVNVTNGGVSLTLVLDSNNNITNLSFVGGTGFTGTGSYQVLETDGVGNDTITGLPAPVTGNVNVTGNLAGSYSATVSIGGTNDNDLVVVIASVPEPSSFALMLGGFVLLLVFQARRRRG